MLKLKSLLSILALIFSSLSFAGYKFKSSPTLIENPSGRVPLAAVIEFNAKYGLRAALQISDGKHTWRATFDTGDLTSGENGLYRIPVLGMRPDRNHDITLTLKKRGREVHQQTFIHRTPRLPTSQTEFPHIDVKISDAGRMEPGVTFLALRRRALGSGRFWSQEQRDWTTKWGKVAAIDHQGEVVWWFESEFRVAGIERLKNGNVLIQRVTASTLEVDLLGNIVTEFYAEKTPDKPTGPNAVKIKGVEVLHHQPHQMSSNGDFLAFSGYSTVFENWYTSDKNPDAPRDDVKVIVDELIQYDREGSIKWSWDALDYLDHRRMGYDTFWSFWWTRGFPEHMDWSHGNGISYYEPDDAILASFRNLSATVMIDKKSKDIKWLLGRHDGWPEEMKEKLLTPVGELMWPGYSHNPRMTDIGTVIIFDNRAHGGPLLAFEEKTPLLERFSRAAEFEVDSKAMTVKQIWTSGDTMGNDPCYTDAMGDAWRLPVTGNRLVIYAFCVARDERLYERKGRNWSDYPFGGRIIEYDEQEIVFRADVYDPDKLFQWEVYGGFRATGLY